MKFEQLNNNENRAEHLEVNYDGCQATLPKGAVVDIEKKLNERTVVTDTGALAGFLKNEPAGKEYDQAAIDELYRETIRQGVIDHHSLDAFLAAKGLRPEKCATQMVFDYQNEVLELINKRKIEKVDTHFDSDMDAIASSYLVKSLIDHQKLPAIAEQLAQITNQTDYGRTAMDEPDVYVAKLPGTLGAIKRAIIDQSMTAVKGMPWGPEKLKILAGYEALRNKLSFELLNILDRIKIGDPGFDLNQPLNIEIVEKQFSPELKAVINAGREASEKDYQEFREDFSRAIKGTVVVKDKAGHDMPANILIANSRSPLMFTNLAYGQSTPDTIIAVYAGKKRLAGDMYDVGIMPDQANVMDIREICVALNKVEAAKRRGAAPNRKKFLAELEQEKEREAFPGYFAMVEQGLLKKTEIIRKDPSPLVAGNSLIPASRHSLLTGKDFIALMKKLRGFKKIK